MYKVSLYLDKKEGDTCHYLRLKNTLKDSRDEELVAWREYAIESD